MNSRPVDTCPICLEAPQAPASVAPCGHGFCHMCIQRWAATAMASTCPICRQPIMAIRLLTLENGPARTASHRRGRGQHPYARPSGQRRQQRVPRGPRRGRRSAEVGEHSPAIARQHVQRPSRQRDNNGGSQLRSLTELSLDLAWLQRVREEEPGSGDHAGRLPLPQYLM